MANRACINLNGKEDDLAYLAKEMETDNRSYIVRKAITHLRKAYELRNSMQGQQVVNE